MEFPWVHPSTYYYYKYYTQSVESSLYCYQKLCQILQKIDARSSLEDEHRSYCRVNWTEPCIANCIIMICTIRLVVIEMDLLEVTASLNYNLRTLHRNRPCCHRKGGLQRLEPTPPPPPPHTHTHTPNNFWHTT